MTKLDWCRRNAPECMSGLNDEEFMELMEYFYEEFCDIKDVIED